MRDSNPLFCKAADGSMTVACISKYLTNVHHLIIHTPSYLARARDRALALGDAALGDHYEHKRSEELGHEAGADRDLDRVGAVAPSAAARDVVPAMRGLVGYLARVIDED